MYTSVMKFYLAETVISKIRDNGALNTPSVVFDERVLSQTYAIMDPIRRRSSVTLLYPLKANSLETVLYRIRDYVDGFAVSSLFEAKLARSVFGPHGRLHFTSPWLSANDAEELASLCEYVSFNSMRQLEQYGQLFSCNSQIGLRVNTQLSLVGDVRYDPAAVPSKLGVPLDDVAYVLKLDQSLLESVAGVLVHANCEATGFDDLTRVIDTLAERVPTLLKQISWINLGGGYLFDETTNWEPFASAVERLQKDFCLEVIFEPGKGVIGEAGSILTTVVDLFQSGGEDIAVLDTTVNHMPEVFEYQYRPSVAEEVEEGQYTYRLYGCTCLAGDYFGAYRFASPLTVGTRLCFEDMGAYTLVKAHMFNGINLPTIYTIDAKGNLSKSREFKYEDFLARNTG